MVPTEFLVNHSESLSYCDTEDRDGLPFDPRLLKQEGMIEELNTPIPVKVLHLVQKLKNNNAPELDSILNEFLKHSPNQLIYVITKLFNTILSTSTVPTSWTMEIIEQIYKGKGVMEDPENYQEITLLSCLGKFFISIFNQRIANYVY